MDPFDKTIATVLTVFVLVVLIIVGLAIATVVQS